MADKHDAVAHKIYRAWLTATTEDRPELVARILREEYGSTDTDEHKGEHDA